MDTSLENVERIIVSVTGTGDGVMLSKERWEQVRQLLGPIAALFVVPAIYVIWRWGKDISPRQAAKPRSQS